MKKLIIISLFLFVTFLLMCFSNILTMTKKKLYFNDTSFVQYYNLINQNFTNFKRICYESKKRKIILFDKNINKYKLKNEFLQNIKNNNVFDSKGIPYELNQNILLLNLNGLYNLSNHQILNILNYLLIVQNTLELSNPSHISKMRKIQKQLQLVSSYFKYNKKEENIDLPIYCNNRVDVIWLYVNGSDPHWIQTYENTLNNKIQESSLLAE